MQFFVGALALAASCERLGGRKAASVFQSPMAACEAESTSERPVDGARDSRFMAGLRPMRLALPDPLRSSRPAILKSTGIRTELAQTKLALSRVRRSDDLFCDQLMGETKAVRRLAQGGP
jgi:hypothetical protein